MPNKPKKWIAVLLGIFVPPIAMLYLSQLRWAGIYLLIALVVGLVEEFYFRDTGVANALQLAYVLTCVTHAYRLAAKYPHDKPRPAYSRWYGLLGAAFGFLLVAFGIRAFVVEPFRFPSGSMLPTIPLRAHLVVQKWGYGNYGTYGIHLLRIPISAPLSRGDIVVFEHPQDRSIHFAKRLIGLPGDKIAYRGKRLSVNGTPISLRKTEAYFDPKAAAYKPRYLESLGNAEYSVLIENDSPAYISTSVTFPFRGNCTYDAEGVSCEVPAGHYFTMGDNRDNSSDSRIWGFVPDDHIVGRVLYIVP